jgi:hypothetical protein
MSTIYRTPTHRSFVHHWDDEDRHYILEALWYLGAPPYDEDYYELVSLDVYECATYDPDIDYLLVRDGKIWRDIEDDGVNLSTLEEIWYG